MIIYRDLLTELNEYERVDENTVNYFIEYCLKKVASSWDGNPYWNEQSFWNNLVRLCTAEKVTADTELEDWKDKNANIILPGGLITCHDKGILIIARDIRADVMSFGSTMALYIWLQSLNLQKSVGIYNSVKHQGYDIDKLVRRLIF